MGCACTKQPPEAPQPAAKRAPKSKRFRKPSPWKTEEPWSEADLQAKRLEFWDTAPHYGGDQVIWDALKAACDADLPTAKIILESAGVVVASDNMTVCYDERGRKYELPKYVMTAPTNLREVKGDVKPAASLHHVELTAGGSPG